jgi:exodeoxyribonuclease VII large subunit
LRDNLLRQHPGQAIKRQKLVLINTIKQLAKTVGQQVHDKRTKTEQTMHLLDTVSPLKTLGRGYSVIRDSQGAVIKTINDVKRGDNLKGQVTDGEISFAVTKTAKKDPSQQRKVSN